MAEKFTPKAKAILDRAKNLSRELGHTHIGTEHILLGILGENDCVAYKILSKYINADEVTKKIKEICPPAKDKAILSDYTPTAKSIIEHASLYASNGGETHTASQHLLLSLMDEDGCVATKILGFFGVRSAAVRGEVEAFTDASPIKVQIDYEDEYSGKSATTALEKYGRNLTREADNGKLQGISGREDETLRLIQILCRKSKNNPCLIGEPGVGKTAIVEGLADKISKGLVPRVLEGKQIISLDLSRMISGAKYRGEFEERIKDVMAQVQSDKSIILFIDELHTIVGAGSAEGALDAANIIKPALSRGEIQIIGATTISEYRNRIEKDSALARRFQAISISEPTASQTLKILSGIRKSLEEHHGLKIPDSVLKYAIDLSVRYITDRFLPDKAIDVIDEAAASVSLRAHEDEKQISEISRELKILFSQKEAAAISGRLDEAKEVRLRERELEGKLKRLSQKRVRTATLTENDIASVITKQTGIPVSRLMQRDTERLLHLPVELTAKIHGQDEAIQTLSRAIRRGRTGLKNPSRPIGTFIFAGSSGVGKTQLAKELAKSLFGSENALVRIDMSEYMEAHSVSKLIGSPPGYIGHGEGGMLTEKIRRAPYSIILFDEIEKAHPDIFNLLLQILDDGILTDSCGRRVDFKNTIIIMTSNIGIERLGHTKLGFAAGDSQQSERAEVMSAIKRTFSPEFINRIDNIIIFRRLDVNDLICICTDMLYELSDRMKKMKISLTFDEDVPKLIAMLSMQEMLGARPLRRNITTHVEDVLSEMLVSGEIKAKDSVILSVDNESITIKKAFS